MTIIAHFDGHAIIPDEPVDLPLNKPLRIQVLAESEGRAPADRKVIEERLRRHAAASGAIVGPSLAEEAIARDTIHD